MIVGSYVDLVEYGGTMEFIEKWICCWHYKAISNDDGIETMIVDAEPPRSIFVFWISKNGDK